MMVKISKGTWINIEEILSINAPVMAGYTYTVKFKNTEHSNCYLNKAQFIALESALEQHFGYSNI